MKLEDTRIAMLVGPGFEDLEFWAVYMRMQEEGAQIDVVGKEAGVEYTGKSGGLTAETEFAADKIGPTAVDAVLVPGGWTPDKIRRDQSVLDLVREAHEADKAPPVVLDATSEDVLEDVALETLREYAAEG